MIDVVREEGTPSVEEVGAILAKAFWGRAGVVRNEAGEVRVWLRTRAFRSMPDACPAESASAFMRQISRFACSAADEIDAASGGGALEKEKAAGMFPAA